MYFVTWIGGKLATKDPKYCACDQQSRSLQKKGSSWKERGERQPITGD